MTSIKVQDLKDGSTVELFLHHNYPLEISSNKNGFFWVVSQNKSGAKAKFVTHFVGRLSSNDTASHTMTVYGGPYAGQGLGRDLGGQGTDYTATATIPWNYVSRMYVLSQGEIPTVSEVHGRLNILKVAVKF
jgi:hypothetical protein